MSQPTIENPVQQYQQKLDELRSGMQRGIPLSQVQATEGELRAIQKEAARQACKALRCLGIHSAKAREYQRRSGGRDNWYRDWLPTILQQQQQLERALALTEDSAQRINSFCL
ncbi:hypothetical protein C4D60_Mb00t02050 [Musa balbisiana]|uniref:Uncharacterized protein n=1 Tax=Musa balbisiana TaxID=52838 RepID=A0A4S8I6K7_MUSBA|nr:hypothetical protein C4D60_Mb00t02050 [Musa balbisiana]